MNKLIDFARRFRGFRAFAAFLILAGVFLMTNVLPQLSTGINRLLPEQLSSIINLVIVLSFGVMVLLVILSYAPSPTRSPRQDSVLYVIVHEAGDVTRGIAGADVTLSLDKNETGRTDEQGNLTFTFPAGLSGRTFAINAGKKSYAPHKPKSVKLENHTQVEIPLTREVTPDPKVPTGLEPPRQPEPLPPLPPCPFVAGPMITDPRLFVGRDAELQLLTWRMRGAQPMSVNIIGERRIGKSSLLYHFFQTWQMPAPDAARYAVIYISLQAAQCRTPAGFFATLARQLLTAPAIQAHPDVIDALRAAPGDDTAFTAALEACRRRLLPVMCLDEFEALLEHDHDFTDDFFNHLRALMDRSLIMFIFSSHHSLDVYRDRHQLTSSFFNVGHTLRLAEFSPPEAEAVVRLPASTVPGTTPALTPAEQQLAQQWAGGHPYKLQLAGLCLWEARQSGRDTAWAQQQYAVQAARLT